LLSLIAPLLALRLLLLLGRRALLLLRLNHLLPRSVALRLSLLALHLPLILRTVRLAHLLALGLRGSAFRCPFIRLLSA
jgi:hypothetical protein